MALTLAALAGGTQASLVVPTQQKEAGKKILKSNYDIRINGKGDLAELAEAYFPLQMQEIASRASSRRRFMQEGLAQLRGRSPGAQAQFSAVVGSAEVVRSSDGALTDPAPGRSASEIALEFLRRNNALYGLTHRQISDLEVLGESGSASGLRMIRLQQTVRGLPVFQSETRVTVDRNGRLIRTVGRLVPGVEQDRVPSGRLISSQEALEAALATVGIDVDPDSMSLRETSPEGQAIQVVASHPQINRTVPSRLVWFPLAPGVLIPAWSQVTTLNGPADWFTLVDARTGSLLYRKNIQNNLTTEEARFSVYSQAPGVPADSPAPASPNALLPGTGAQFPEISRTIESMLGIQDPTASPDGWIPDGGNTTTGNNVDAYLDRTGSDTPDIGALDNDGRPIGNVDIHGRNRDFLGVPNFTYMPPPVGGDPDAGDDLDTAPYQRGVVTNLFYITNSYHDRLYNLGFDEAAGNFQTGNFGRGGVGGDPVLAEAQQSAGSLFGGANTANFSVGPDGTPGIMRMFVWNFPSPIRDGSLDAEIVIHELTHGVTNRVIGNAAGLNWTPGRGMGEGWSDFFALSLLNSQATDDPDGQYAPGAYAVYMLAFLTDNYVYGIRRFPYSTDNTVNPLTWADVDEITDDMSGGFAPSPLGFEANGAFEVHNSGEVWALSLWEVRSRIIAANGGDIALGNEITLQIVTDGLKMTPIDPSFTQARDALFDADCAANACANEESIWAGFADRGLGYGAETSLGIAAHVGIKESFSVPHLDVSSVVVDDSLGNNNGFIDPGEIVSITVELLNPWLHSSKGVDSASATLSSLTAEVLVNDAASSYGPIPAQGFAVGDTFTFTVDPGATCGQTLAFELQTTSSLGTFAARFGLRVGQPIGAGAPVTLTRVIPGGLSIPENSPAGATSTFSVAEDLEILALDFRVDSLTHTAVGDLTVELKAPSGFGADLIYRMADCIPFFGCFLGGNAGDDFVNTRIDDASTNDLVFAGESAAPFTGDWFAIFNSTAWVAPDPVGQLSNYNGIGTSGDWQVFVSDLADNDVGRLNSWSLIVTPMVFSCCEATCGNNTVECSEVCDGTVLNGESCQSQGFDTGTLACDGTCDGFDTSGCSDFVCGNGVREGGEECDGTDLGSSACADFGCTGGSLSCTAASCTLDSSSCTGCAVCGNAICETGEDCNTCSSDCFTGPGIAVCGNGICEAANGEDCFNCEADCNEKLVGNPSKQFCCGQGGLCPDNRCNADPFSCTETTITPTCCGDLVCEGTESGSNCETDCGPPPACGDLTCDPGEDPCSCSSDCGTPPTTETSCTDGVDNDCDTLTDCDDPDCSDDPVTCPICTLVGDPCTSDQDCCTNKCKGKAGSKTCKG